MAEHDDRGTGRTLYRGREARQLQAVVGGGLWGAGPVCISPSLLCMSGRKQLYMGHGSGGQAAAGSFAAHLLCCALSRKHSAVGTCAQLLHAALDRRCIAVRGPRVAWRMSCMLACPCWTALAGSQGK